MKRSIIRTVLIAAAFLLSASLSLAVESKAAATGEAISNPKAADKSAKTKKAATRVKRVDINSASKAQLKKLPGIKDAEADKIIAGRPYLSKAHLVSHDVIPRAVYEQIKGQIIAIQKLEAKKK